jgi:hypothetical protein
MTPMKQNALVWRRVLERYKYAPLPDPATIAMIEMLIAEYESIDEIIPRD